MVKINLYMVWCVVSMYIILIKKIIVSLYSNKKKEKNRKNSPHEMRKNNNNNNNKNKSRSLLKGEGVEKNNRKSSTRRKRRCYFYCKFPFKFCWSNMKLKEFLQDLSFFCLIVVWKNKKNEKQRLSAAWIDISCVSLFRSHWINSTVVVAQFIQQNNIKKCSTHSLYVQCCRFPFHSSWRLSAVHANGNEYSHGTSHSNTMLHIYLQNDE